MKFSEKVLTIRLKLNLSQQALAKELGVAFVTVNRWENNHAEPQILLRHRFEEYCKANNINFNE